MFFVCLFASRCCFPGEGFLGCLAPFPLLGGWFSWLFPFTRPLRPPNQVTPVWCRECRRCSSGGEEWWFSRLGWFGWNFESPNSAKCRGFYVTIRIVIVLVDQADSLNLRGTPCLWCLPLFWCWLDRLEQPELPWDFATKHQTSHDGHQTSSEVQTKSHQGKSRSKSQVIFFSESSTIITITHHWGMFQIFPTIFVEGSQS